MIFYFFFFFDSMYRNPIVQKAYQLVMGDKLRADGYCDIGMYLHARPKKEELTAALRQIRSPIAELYKASYPRLKTIEDEWSAFAQHHLETAQPHALTMVEAQALINWVFRAFSSVSERNQASAELVQKLDEHYQLNGALKVSQGVLFDSARVDLHFVSSIDQFNRAIKDIEEPGHSIFYRGHALVNYRLAPSIKRRRQWEQHEREMYNELMIQCPHEFERDKSHLERLVHMQHYGLPTRLLDISRNPLVALYFACEQETEQYGELVLFDVERTQIKYPQSDTVSILASLPLFSYEDQQQFLAHATEDGVSQQAFNARIQRLLHEVKSEKPAFRDEVVREHLIHCYVVLSPKNNHRIVKQDGAFIICGLSPDSDALLNEKRYKDKSSKAQICIITDKKKLLKQLATFSITKATLFPEIDDVADFIKGSY
ncbi:FRG domain-containing protein [Gorillibacterium sp. CAU 1737]|uniref:FRG domain-containing protein n=1 Tax=Gorillibacterium sp. CAU 1737 TaxID=3140362 RepID=UPI003260DE70